MQPDPTVHADAHSAARRYALCVDTPGGHLTQPLPEPGSSARTTRRWSAGGPMAHPIIRDGVTVYTRLGPDHPAHPHHKETPDG